MSTMSTKIQVYELEIERADEVRTYIEKESDETVFGSYTGNDYIVFEIDDPYDAEAVEAVCDRLAADFELTVKLECEEYTAYFGVDSEPLNFREAVSKAVIALDNLAQFKNVEERTGFWDIDPIIVRLEALKYDV